MSAKRFYRIGATVGAIWGVFGLVFCGVTGGMQAFLVLWLSALCNLFFLGKTVASTIGFVSHTRIIGRPHVSGFLSLMAWLTGKLVTLMIVVKLMVDVSRSGQVVPLVLGAATIFLVPLASGVWIGIGEFNDGK